MEEEDPDANINDELTIEGMLQVIDTGTGKTADVRKMLGIKPKDIKDEQLREKISNYSIINSQNTGVDDSDQVEGMGDYFAKLDTLEFDMGKFEDDEETKTNATADRKTTQWTDWWQVKQMQNEKLKQAILANNKEKVKELLTDENLLVQGY
jgi:hypothetical protein